MTEYKLNDGAVEKRVGDKIVVVNIESGDYFTLNESASFIWTHLLDNGGMSNLQQAFMKTYEVDEEEFTRDLSEFLDNLVEKKILTTREEKSDG